MTYGITSSVTCRVMCGIAERKNRPMTHAATGLATDWVTRGTAEEALRGTAGEIPLRTMTEIALLTRYDTTVRATP